MPEEETKTVFWYDHDCAWVTKFCDEEHLKVAIIPMSIIREYTK